MDYAAYKVKSGDTLSKIAANYGTTTKAIASANGLTDANKISIGQQLNIPVDTSTNSKGGAAVDELEEVVITAQRAVPMQAGVNIWLQAPRIYIVAAGVALLAWLLSDNER